MGVQTVPVVLVLDTGHGDEEYAEKQLQDLITELRELDLDSIDRMPQDPPPGSRTTAAVLKIGEDEIELTGASDEVQQRAQDIDPWRRRCGGGGPERRSRPP